MNTKIIVLALIMLLGHLGYVSAQNGTTTTTTTTTTTEVNSQQPEGNSEQSPNNIPRFYLAARFMPTFSKFDVSDNDNGTLKTSAVLGYGFGGVLGFNLTRHLGIQAEVIYTQLSQKYSRGSINRKIDLSYVNVPLMLVLNTDVSKPVNFNVTVGPQLGFNTGSQLNSTDGVEVDSVSAVIAVKPMDFGIAYGAGFDFRLGKSLALELGFRGVYGILDVSDDKDAITTNQYYILHRSHIKTYAGYIGLKLTL